MERIGPHRLWIGHAGDVRDFAALHREGIEVVVQLAIEEVPATLPRGFLAASFPLIDGPGNRPEILDLAIRFIGGSILHRLPILVSCGAGLSRSPALTAAAMAWAGEGSPDECLAHLSTHRRADVSPGLWSEVRRAIPNR
ncbi:protein tyrosine phosphatase [Tundrisphaera sp. TA3]|uniref:phosphatase domain-containing putative toxin n=1 Tax=Tundrisphaera sp. TA3 TaxID=3435775 RepID=UPI003EBAAF6E